MTTHARGPARRPVYLDDETHRDLRILSASRGCSAGEAVRQLLDEDEDRHATLADLRIEREVKP